MKKIWCAPGMTLIAISPSWAQAPQAPAAEAPALLPGEGLALAEQAGPQQAYGQSQTEAPMGSLAQLLWLSLEGSDWEARSVKFKCKGTWNGFHCSNPKGHGRVDLAKATQEGCTLAYLSWVLESAEYWKKDYGEGAARIRLEQAFRPFLGKRLPPGETLPAFGPAWVGDGDLLRTTPQAMATWLADQEDLLNRCKRLMGGVFDGLFTKGAAWWFIPGTALAPGTAAATSAWVAGSDGQTAVVLFLPRGRGPIEGLARMKAVLRSPKK